MSAVTFEIAFDDGATKVVSFERGKIKLKALRILERAQRDASWDTIIPAIAALLGLTEDEADDLTIEQWEAIAGAMREATKDAATIPNESAPPSE